MDISDDGTIEDALRPFRLFQVERVCGPVMSRAGGNMQRATRERALVTPHLTHAGTTAAHYASSIQWRTDGPLAVEVYAAGRGRGAQGPLSGILEYGHGANAPHPHFIPSLDEEVEPTAMWLGRAIAEAFWR